MLPWGPCPGGRRCGRDSRRRCWGPAASPDPPPAPLLRAERGAAVCRAGEPRTSEDHPCGCPGQRHCSRLSPDLRAVTSCSARPSLSRRGAPSPLLTPWCRNTSRGSVYLTDSAMSCSDRGDRCRMPVAVAGVDQGRPSCRSTGNTVATLHFLCQRGGSNPGQVTVRPERQGSPPPKGGCRPLPGSRVTTNVHLCVDSKGPSCLSPLSWPLILCFITFDARRNPTEGRQPLLAQIQSPHSSLTLTDCVSSSTAGVVGRVQSGEGYTPRLTLPP